MSEKWTQSHTNAQHWRSRVLNLRTREILFADFRGTEQAHDLSEQPNCAGIGRIHHFRRRREPDWPPNPLPMDPAASALGTAPVDEMRVEEFQVAACNWRCWYCFVPESLLSADRAHSRWLSVPQLLDLYAEEGDLPKVIVLSGGQPDLVPEWTVWMMQELQRRSLHRDTYLWSDDNLSSDLLWEVLSSSEIGVLTSYRNYGRVGCFKGFDQESFAFNTRSDATGFDRQFEILGRLIDLGLDVYAYVTLTAPNTKKIDSKISRFVDRLQRVDEVLPLRTVPLRIERFTPMMARTNPLTTDALQIQDEAIRIWNRVISERFPLETRSNSIFSHRLLRNRRGGTATQTTT